MYISNINWPNNSEDRVALYLRFMLLVIDDLDINFPEELGDPVGIAKSFLLGDVSRKFYDDSSATYWRYIETKDALREFSDKKILLARLAISLLSANKDVEEMGEKLSWFFEVLDYLGLDSDKALNTMRQHFTFSGKA